MSTQEASIDISGCAAHHRLVALSGRMHVVMDDEWSSTSGPRTSR
jgi:hypothetical protein